MSRKDLLNQIEDQKEQEREETERFKSNCKAETEEANGIENQ